MENKETKKLREKGYVFTGTYLSDRPAEEDKKVFNKEREEMKALGFSVKKVKYQEEFYLFVKRN